MQCCFCGEELHHKYKTWHCKNCDTFFDEEGNIAIYTSEKTEEEKFIDYLNDKIKKYSDKVAESTEYLRTHPRSNGRVKRIYENTVYKARMEEVMEIKGYVEAMNDE